MDLELDTKHEEIQKDKDWFDTDISQDQKVEEKGKKPVDPDGRCDLKFEMLTKFFQKINDSKG